MKKRKTFTISISRTIDVSSLGGPDQYIKVGSSSTFETDDNTMNAYKEAHKEVLDEVNYSLKDIYGRIKRK